MTSWIQRQADSHHAQLAGAAVLSGAAVASAILGYQAIKRKAAVEHLKSSIPVLDGRDAQRVGTLIFIFTVFFFLLLFFLFGIPSTVIDWE